MANEIDADFELPEGVHVLSDSSYRKHVRKLPFMTCEACGKRKGEGGIDIRRCTGCWSIGYCSAECQRSLWPTHKQQCNTLSTVLTLEGLARSFYSSPFLLHYLRVALITKLGLLTPSLPGPPPSSEAFPSVIIHIHMHPITKEHENGIYSGEIPSSGKDKIPGYLIVGISEEPVAYIPISLGSGGSGQQRQSGEDREHSMMLRAYKQAKKDADAQGRGENPIVMVDFGYDEQLVNVGIEITPDAFATARGDAPPDYAVLPDGVGPLAAGYSVHDVLKLASKYIELDEEDRLKLRMDLRPIDKKFYYQKAQYLLFGRGPSSFNG